MMHERAGIGWGRAAIAGPLDVAAALVSGALVAAIVDAATPVNAVGTRTIDLAPRVVKDWAIRTFGTGDKPALQVGIIVILLLLSVPLARVAADKWPAAAISVGVVGLIGVLSAKPSVDGQLAWLPALFATVVALTTLRLLTRAAAPASAHRQSADAQPMPVHRGLVPLDRRAFMSRAASVGAGTVGAGVVGKLISNSQGQRVEAAAAKIWLPVPSLGAAAPAIPATASVGEGVEPFITPASDFYRIDTALVPPAVDLDGWRLKIDGMVDTPREYTFQQLLDRPDLVERIVTLCCVSNEVGGPYVGNARWLGVPLVNLLREAGIKKGATQIASTSDDGWTCGFPTELALDGRDALVAIGMNGEPLPRVHGFPVRLVVPGVYGYVSATKWLTEITLTTMDDFNGYWIPRGWSKEAPVKTQSRIDVPRAGDRLRAGPVPIAGVAWAQHRGITGVEVRVDDGEWQTARLADEVSVDAWRQWVYSWEAAPGRHRLWVRATDATGRAQTGDRADVAPDGATGWHHIDVEVA